MHFPDFIFLILFDHPKQRVTTFFDLRKYGVMTFWVLFRRFKENRFEHSQEVCQDLCVSDFLRNIYYYYYKCLQNRVCE